MTVQRNTTSSLPGIAAKMTIRLIEAKPSSFQWDWDGAIPKILSKSVRLDKELNDDSAIVLLQDYTQLSSMEQRLVDNLDRLCSLFALPYPCADLLMFILLLSVNEGVEELYNDMEQAFARSMLQRINGHLFKCDMDTLKQAQERLFELGFIDDVYITGISAIGIPYFLRNALLSERIETKEQLLAPLVHTSKPAQFGLNSFGHFNSQLANDYLSAAIKLQTKGVSLLLYGDSGHGKTEFARTLAQSNNRQLIEVRGKQDRDNDSRYSYGQGTASDERLHNLKLLQTLLDNNSNAMLLIDECESVFDQADNRYTKERLQRLIEDTQIPCIWITNHITWLEPSYIRRFKLVMEVTAPDKSQLETIIQGESKTLRLSKTFKQQWASTDNLSPAIVANACEIAKTLSQTGKAAESTVSEITENTLTASGLYTAVPKYQGDMVFDKTFLNFKGNKSRIRDIEQAIDNDAPIRILLTGPPGTGKTAYVHHLAEQIDKPLIRVTASDVLSKYVGESEQQVTTLFHRAHQEQAIILLDEVDSLLASRQKLNAQHDVQLVNELLAQLECNSQPVFAATNYAAKLDHAVLRRFDIKLECTYLSTEQTSMLFKQTLGIQHLTQSERMTLAQLQYLTPGDFAIVARHKLFNPKAAHRQTALSLLVDENRRKQPKAPIGFSTKPH